MHLIIVYIRLNVIFTTKSCWKRSIMTQSEGYGQSINKQRNIYAIMNTINQTCSISNTMYNILSHVVSNLTQRDPVKVTIKKVYYTDLIM